MRKFYKEIVVESAADSAGEIAAYSIEEAKEISFGLLNAARIHELREVDRNDFRNIGFWISPTLIYYPATNALTISDGFKKMTIKEEDVLALDVRSKDTHLKIKWEDMNIIHRPGITTDGEYLYFETNEDMMEFVLQS